jgi:hypothetical protein
MRHDIAEKITKLIMEYQGKLNASTLLVQETCTEEEFQVYRQAVGRATDFMFSELTRALNRASEEDDLGRLEDFGQLDDFDDYEDRTLKFMV